MKNLHTQLRNAGFLLLVAFTVIACGKDSDGGGDPFKGVWALKAIVQNGKVVDITSNNIPCFKNSKLTVTSSDFNLFFSAPASAQSSNCESVTEKGTWVKRDGKYYISQNGQEAEFPLRFNDNNQTLQFTYGSGADAFDLVFRKEGSNSTSGMGNTQTTQSGAGVYAGI